MVVSRAGAWQTAAMLVSEATIAQVIAETSDKLDQAEYISARVDQIAAEQPNILQYVIGHREQLSVAAIVQVLFWVAMVCHSIERAGGQALRVVDYEQLDAAATRARTLDDLAELEPNLASFIHSNLDVGTNDENQLARTLLAHISSALLEI